VPRCNTFATRPTAARPAGRPVGDVVDGTLLVTGGSLPYRLYRPATPGPHPIVVYFHGGGWVLGDQISDEPFCRDLCRRSGMIFVSVGYRHAPEHRFPTAAEDGYAATRWITPHSLPASWRTPSWVDRVTLTARPSLSGLPK
jgi:acetyl esterase/lipase